jgi:DNA-binding transcriptional regulator YhcF (GntR family)
MKLFADNIPIYLQLKTEVETAILNSSLRAEEALESIRSMAARYQINPLTVSKAVQELEDEGIIYKKRGIGFYVTSEAYAILRQKYLRQYLDSEVSSFVQKARQLKLSLAEVIKLIEENYSKSVVPAQAGTHAVLDSKDVTDITDQDSASAEVFNTRRRGNDEQIESNPIHTPENKDKEK